MGKSGASESVSQIEVRSGKRAVMSRMVPKPHPYKVCLGTTPALRATPPNLGRQYT